MSDFSDTPGMPQLGDTVTTSASALTGVVSEIAEMTKDGRHVRIALDITEPDGTIWTKWTMYPISD